MHTVTVRTRKGLEVEMTAGEHRLLCDEKRDVGGHDAGPSPKELLLAAIASCGAITMSMYAQRKGWLLEAASIRAEAHDPEEKGGPVRVVQTIELKGNLDDEQRSRLMEIAGRCPVHKMVTGGMTVEERLA
jgi:putative redox protein